MYRKIILISSFVCLCISFQSVAQSIKTNLYVTLIPCDSSHFSSCVGLHIADITQEFVLEKFSMDTLFLKLENIHNFLHSFIYSKYYQKLTVDIISKNKKQSVKPDFDGITLRIPLPTSSCTVKLNYFYSSDYAVRSLNSNAPHYVWPCEHLQQSWYFTCSDMKIDKVEFSNPDDSLLYLFVEASTSKQNGKIILDTEKMSDQKNINFFLFEKPFFHETTYLEETDTINIHLDRGRILIPTPGGFWNNVILPGNRGAKSLEDSSKSFISHALKKINAIFPPLQMAVIDVFDADLSIDNTITWGRSASDMNNHHHLILIDTSHWHNHTLTHELIHLYNNVSLSENDSTYYFFNESITEYLAVCLWYEDKQERDLVFNRKIIKFAKEPNEDYSIFKLSSNSRDGNTARGSALVVYDKTPFIIHALAQMVGEEEFHTALKYFYTKIAEGMEVNLPSLEQILKKNGVTDGQWNWFIQNL